MADGQHTTTAPRVDWDRLRAEVEQNDFAAAFLFLADRLGISGD